MHITESNLNIFIKIDLDNLNNKFNIIKKYKVIVKFSLKLNHCNLFKQYFYKDQFNN